MNKKIKTAKIGVIISSLAVIISGYNMYLSSFNTSRITVFICALVILLSNVTIYTLEKNKDE